MNINSFKWLTGSMALGPLLILGCNLNLGNHDFGDQRPRVDVETKTVEVKEFAKIDVKKRLEDAGIATKGFEPRFVARSGPVIYFADGSGSMKLFSWRVEKGDGAEAWKRLSDFVGSDLTANFDLTPIGGSARTIKQLAPVKGGVAVAVSGDETKAVPGGVAMFRDQGKKAAWSSKLFVPYENFDKEFADIVEASAQGRRALYVPLWDSTHGTSSLTWLDLNFPKRESIGYKHKIPPAGEPEDILRFSDGGLWSFVMQKAAAAPLPDGRVALATFEGLFTIELGSVGVGASDNPRLEQKDHYSFLDGDHKNQFKTNKKAPTQVGALRMVDDFLLITFIDDGTGNGGLKFAKFKEDEAGKVDLKFTTNLDAPRSKVHRIVVDGLEARLLSENGGDVYGFRIVEGEGNFFLEFASSAIERANISQGALLTQFKGGATGEVPTDPIRFFDAAPYNGVWYYTSSLGVYKVETKRVTRRFNKTTGQPL